MRVESFKINAQAGSSKPKPSQWLERLVIWLYALALKLYPQSFKDAFADEMRSVFAMTIREARSPLHILIAAAREAFELPANLFCARRQFPLFAHSHSLWRARQVVRWSSLALSLFMLHGLIMLLGDWQAFSVQGLVFFLLLFLTLASMLLAWRWERLGGLLTMGFGTAMGFFLVFYIAHFHPVEVSFIGLSLIGILWSLPFVTLGMLYFQLSHYAAVDFHQSPATINRS